MLVTDPRVLDEVPLDAVEALTLCGPEVRDLARLTGAQGLRRLVLDETAVADLSVLAGLPCLEVFSAYDNPRIRYDALSEARGLRQVTLGGRLSFGARAVSVLPAVEQLSLYGSDDDDLTWLAGVPSLTSLTVAGAPVSPGWVAGMAGLAQLRLTRTWTADLGPIARLTGLEVFWSLENGVDDVRPLQGLTALTVLLLYHNRIAKIGPLSGLTRLTRLGLSNNRISRLPDLGALRQLETLNLDGNWLRDVSALGVLPSLRYLNLSGNRVRDPRPLASLKQLRVLLLRRRGLDLAALREQMPWLVRLE